jgi:hypothetical protein
MDGPALEYSLPLSAVWLQAFYLTSLSLAFLSYKVGIYSPSSANRVKWDDAILLSV